MTSSGEEVITGLPDNLNFTSTTNMLTSGQVSTLTATNVNTFNSFSDISASSTLGNGIVSSGDTATKTFMDEYGKLVILGGILVVAFVVLKQ